MKYEQKMNKIIVAKCEIVLYNKNMKLETEEPTMKRKNRLIALLLTLASLLLLFASCNASQPAANRDPYVAVAIDPMNVYPSLCMPSCVGDAYATSV